MSKLLDKIRNKILWKFFYFNEKFFKVHLLPIHFYSPVPDTRNLTNEDFNKEFNCRGIDWNNELQLSLLENKFLKYREEFTPDQNSGLSLVDAFILYAFVREKKPSEVVEIGGGESTKIILLALQKNREEGDDFKFKSIDPFPRKAMLEAQDENLVVIPKMVQDVPLETFKQCDFLFIDSSHVSKFKSDVNYEILEILPTLKSGALNHWHDIFFPLDYSQEWISKSGIFWNESYMLQAFMTFNSEFKIVWAAKYMQVRHYELLRECFPYFNKGHSLTSFWAERE